MNTESRLSRTLYGAAVLQEGPGRVSATQLRDLGDEARTMEGFAPRLATVWKFLDGLDGVYVLNTLLLTIGRTTYPAVSYSRPQSDGVSLYVLGDLPPSYRRNPGGTYTVGVRYDLGEGFGTYYVSEYLDPAALQGVMDRGGKTDVHPIDPNTGDPFIHFTLFSLKGSRDKKRSTVKVKREVL